MKKRMKKEVFVYEKGIELIVMLGELTEDQVSVEGLKINDAKTSQLREVMHIIVSEVKKEFAQQGIKDEETLQFVNSTIKSVFGEIVRGFDFNAPFYGKYGELKFTCMMIKKWIAEERSMLEQEILYEDMFNEKMELEEDFIF